MGLKTKLSSAWARLRAVPFAAWCLGAGTGMVSHGVFLISEPAGWIVTGMIAIFSGLFLIRVGD